MTIKDLAALSGYSLGTVSRVLNNQPHVSEKAREQIMAIVKEQGFELNTNARNLKQTHSNNILVIVRGTHNELFAALVERLQTVATGGEYQLVVDYIGELDNEVRRAVKRVREVKPQGILFLGGSSEDFIESFAEIHIPAVLVTNSAAEFQFTNLSSVTTDDTAAAAAAVGYLADMGHKKIAVIDGCGPVRTFFMVVLPMMKPTFISVGVLEIMWVWNDFLLPYLVLDRTKYMTIPIVIQYLKGSYGQVDMGATMALILLSILPVIVFYLLCQKHIIKGVAAGAVKG